MCGIFGILSAQNLLNDEAILALGETQRHRGPDNLGYFVDREQGVALCHNRLAILDLSSLGNQPMVSSRGRYTMIFNGEIYNHIELRLALTKKNPQLIFRGTSDTETILELIEQHGVDASLKLMNGMFALAVWDSSLNILILARDRTGEKPLYVGKLDEQFVFSSELKPLLKGFSYELEADAASLMLSLGYVPQPFSIIKNVFKLEPGSYLTLTKQQLGKSWDLNTFYSLSKKYWDINDVFSLDCIRDNENNLIDALEKLLERSVTQKVIADVAVGACLSGGIDSSLVVALMQKVSKSPINTFTVGFENKQYNEAGYAKKIAEYLGCHHTEVYLTANELLDMIPAVSQVSDEPFGDASLLPTLLVSKILKSNVTVALSGDGGDELFMGYPRHRQAPALWSTFKAFSAVFGVLAGTFPEHLRLRYFKLWRLTSRLGAPDFRSFYTAQTSNNPSRSLFAESHGGVWDGLSSMAPAELDVVKTMMFTDLRYYLPDDILVKVDRASMYYSLEMRAPFLDPEIISFAASLPTTMKVRNGKQKWLCRKLLERYLPSDLYDRPKQGFSVPLTDWLTSDLREWAEELLQSKYIEKIPGLKYSAVMQAWNLQKSGRSSTTSVMWNILMLLAWVKEWQS